MKKYIILALCLVVLVSGCIKVVDDTTYDNDAIREKDPEVSEKLLVDEILNLTEDELVNEGYPPEE